MDNYIKRFFDREHWAEVALPEPQASKYILEISNYGVAKRTEKETKKVLILTEWYTEGYAQVKFSVLDKISDKDNNYFIKIRKEIVDLDLELKELTATFENGTFDIFKSSELATSIEQKQKELDKTKNKYQQKYKKITNSRRMNYSSLAHRLVATYFLDKPSEEHNLVAHMDFDKLNNHHSNLKWMTRAENVKHQLNSPYVIKSKIKALSEKRTTNSKLTTTQVSILKKRMNEGALLSHLAKRYKITHTQLLRIKRGQNWTDVPAAR